ncbi:MAG: hypothetical protein KME42_03750 [Tildeniella nuda ZEHNDER 1965/U140]|nr:hypothetical protein [Tildeniella nuda ZEHNDER 1965/U140]
MESDYQHVLEKQKKRFEVLRAIFIDTNGEETKTSLSGKISQLTGIPLSELVHILRYLKQEGLIRPLALINADSERIPILILHQGVVEIEAAISKPHEPTEHFPAQIFNIINNAPVAGQQFGNQNTLNVTQRSNLVEAAAEIQQLLKQLEQSYPTETFAQKAVVVDEAIKQIEGDPSFRNRVVGALKSAGKEAFKEAIDHPLVNVFMAAIEGWQEG